MLLWQYKELVGTPEETRKQVPSLAVDGWTICNTWLGYRKNPITDELEEIRHCIRGK